MSGLNELFACCNSNATVNKLPFKHREITDKIVINDESNNFVSLKCPRIGDLTIGFVGKFLKEKKFVTESNEKDQLICADHVSESLLAYRIIDEFKNGQGFIDILKSIVRNVPGGYSFVIIYGNEIFAVRDMHGVHPLLLATSKSTKNDVIEYDLESDNAFEKNNDRNANVIASSREILDKSGSSFIRQVLPGEIVMLDGVKATSLGIMYRPSGDSSTLCGYRYLHSKKDEGYTKILNDQSTNKVHYKLGFALGESCFNNECDLVTTLPNIDMAYLMGFVTATKVNVDDLFCHDNDKLKLYEDDLNKRAVGLVIDSISNQELKEALELLKKSNVGSVYLYVISPLQTNECEFGVKLPNNLLDNQLCESYSVTAVKHLIIKDFSKAISSGIVNKEISNIDHCLHCFGIEHSMMKCEF